MAKLNRIGNTEQLIQALQSNDDSCLSTLDNYEALYDSLGDLADGYVPSVLAERILKNIGDLIDEAMNREGFNGS